MAVIIPLTMDGVYRLVDLMVFGAGAIWILSISDTKPVERNTRLIYRFFHCL